MKRPSPIIVILVTAGRVARAEFDGGLRSCSFADRQRGTLLVEGVRAGIGLGGRIPGRLWVLAEDIWSQRIALAPAQVAGLSGEQLSRALSFEVEPFSGIPVSAAAVAFRDEGGGSFHVVEISRTERDVIERTAADAGGKLAGIVHVEDVPGEEEAIREWLPSALARVQSGSVPVIAPPAPQPSANRFFHTGIALTAAALLLLFLSLGWTTVRRKYYEGRDAEYTAASRRIDAATKRAETARAELAVLDKEQTLRERVVDRRSSVLALLRGIANTRPQDVVIRGIESEGPSTLVVSGFSIDASAVEELGIVLTHTLRDSGWTARPRHKTGRKHLASGGPWEFSIAVTHDEAAADPGRITQREAE